MIDLVFLMFFGVVLSGPARAEQNDSLSTLCLGPENTQNRVIYFHGMDVRTVGMHETKIRENLKEIANELRIRIALPRAKDPCPKDSEQLCWRQKSSDDVKRTIEDALKSSEVCFGGKKPEGILGFSNGGYLVGKVASEAECLPFSFKYMVAIGSAGTFRKSGGPKRLGCGSFTLMIGKKDRLTYDSALRFFTQLKNERQDVSLLEYDGRHEIPKEDLKHVLKDLILKNK